jgi:hypothetical protein
VTQDSVIFGVMDALACRNCGSTINGFYCSFCGQRSKIGRPTLRGIAAEFVRTVFLVESKLLKTLQELILRPGVKARRYVEGQTVRYVAPVQFFLFAITLYLIIKHFFGDAILSYFPEASETGRGISGRSAMVYISQNANLFGFLQAPILAFWLWLGMRRSGVNFAECLILVFYLVAVSIFFMGLLVMLTHVSGKFMFLRSIVILIYYPWVCMQFSGKKTTGSFFTFAALSLAAYLSFIIFVAGTTIAYFIVF